MNYQAENDTEEIYIENNLEVCESESCSICLSPRNMEQYQCPHCKKKFHLTCLIQWLNESRTCPMCRKEIKIIKLTDKVYKFNSFDILNYEESIDDLNCNYPETCKRICRWVCTILLCSFILVLTVLLILSKL